VKEVLLLPLEIENYSMKRDHVILLPMQYYLDTTDSAFPSPGSSFSWVRFHDGYTGVSRVLSLGSNSTQIQANPVQPWPCVNSLARIEADVRNSVPPRRCPSLPILTILPLESLADA
jgi:hypothetical protein